MYQEKQNIISLIPAKGNSTKLKKKNLLKLNGLTLFEIAIIASKKTKKIKETYISSDLNKIINISKKYNIKCIKRKKSLASSKTLASEVILNFIKNYKKENKNLKKNTIILYLQPTSPFRNHHHLNKALNIFLKKKPSILISVKESENFYKSLKYDKTKITPFFKKNYINLNRQELPKVLIPNGAIFIFYLHDFYRLKNFNFSKTEIYRMNNIESLDIDNKEDYITAKKLSLHYLKYKNG